MRKTAAAWHAFEKQAGPMNWVKKQVRSLGKKELPGYSDTRDAIGEGAGLFGFGGGNEEDPRGNDPRLDKFMLGPGGTRQPSMHEMARIGIMPVGNDPRLDKFMLGPGGTRQPSMHEMARTGPIIPGHPLWSQGGGNYMQPPQYTPQQPLQMTDGYRRHMLYNSGIMPYQGQRYQQAPPQGYGQQSGITPGMQHKLDAYQQYQDKGFMGRLFSTNVFGRGYNDVVRGARLKHKLDRDNNFHGAGYTQRAMQEYQDYKNKGLLGKIGFRMNPLNMGRNIRMMDGATYNRLGGNPGSHRSPLERYSGS